MGPAAQIKPGMTLAEVEAILGPGADMPAPASGGNRIRVWMTKEGPVPVKFNGDDRVGERGVLNQHPPSWFDELRGRLGW
jgi:hypothetical protein